MSVGRFLCSRYRVVPIPLGSVRVWERQGTQCMSVCVPWMSASQCLRFVCASLCPSACPCLCLQTPSGQCLSARPGLSSQLSVGFWVHSGPSLYCTCGSLCLCALWGQGCLCCFCSGCPHRGLDLSSSEASKAVPSLVLAHLVAVCLRPSLAPSPVCGSDSRIEQGSGFWGPGSAGRTL